MSFTSPDASICPRNIPGSPRSVCYEEVLVSNDGVVVSGSLECSGLGRCPLQATYYGSEAHAYTPGKEKGAHQEP